MSIKHKLKVSFRRGIMRGERLRHIREALDYTQEQLAEMLGVGVLQIYRYESGKNTPSGEIVAKIAQILGVSTDYLLGLTDDPIPSSMQGVQLNTKERAILAALRRGERMEAIKIIANDEKAHNGV
jgi:transcriptional regulator with XRE-family HTH domain